ncbi:MAG: BREX system P-loop protein BrxC [Gudongella sp.]|nr:BREX system P-loop protein BrxC [Gudongella sp.]
MYIKDMFVKPIDRDIKGVIKVGQHDDENVRQELDEYVVTRELQKHFADFFSSYQKGINGHTDNMGVWISGFFGSGKSHFLKILSYLLENKVVNGKSALDYFIDDDKIIDPKVLGDMKLAASIPTDVVLFNIDSKSEVSGSNSKEVIVSVFLKVFNEMQGYYGAMPQIAELERELDETGKYEIFKKKFEEEFGDSWEDLRSKFDFIQDTVVQVLDEIGVMSEEAGRNWCEKATEPYIFSIDRFSEMVKKYIDNKGKNHHLVFMVDEMGQYVGDDSKLMLNLQTITEDLGTKCNGKVWIVVTSQEDIDSITEVRGNDFSKITGRFDTRLSLSAANVDEVIKKRILVKNDTGEQTLRVLYEQMSTVVKNLIVFNDEVEKKLYTDSDDFALVYPFIPYQFNLLASVLTSIRIHGASGKHLAEGARSMLALFKESAMKLMDREQGALVPFNLFYDALHQFLDQSHKGVIIKAEENGVINPDKEEDCFNVSVLKALFMIKYVDLVAANVDNITTLMVSAINTDRIELKKKVEEALTILQKQMLVQKNGELYVFLTNEEQEINREIENQNIEMAEVISKVSELIFEDIYSEKKYRHPQFNGRYNFSFNQIVDERPYKANQSYDIGLRILTPGSEYGGDETTLRMKSGQGKEVIVVLPEDRTFINELASALKIERYLRLTTTNKIAKFEQIKDSKRSEMRTRRDNAKFFLKEALKEADIYVNGDRAQLTSKDISSRINEALGRLVTTVYHKLEYINTPMDEGNIRKLFSTTDQQSIDFENIQEANHHALGDLFNFIKGNTDNHQKTSIKSIKDRFMKAPYGYVDNDIEWLVANLFKKGQLSFTVSGEGVNLVNRSIDELIRYITKKEYLDKLLTDVRKSIPNQEKKSVKEILKELFNHPLNTNNEDSIMETFQKQSTTMIYSIENLESKYEIAPYPGKNILKSGKSLLRGACHISNLMEFFSNIHRDREEYLDFSEEYETVRRFFEGEQKNIFENALKLMKIYDDSKAFIADQEIERLVENIKEILKKEIPYSDIPKLPELTKKFEDEYNKLLDEKMYPVIEAIKDARETILKELNKKIYKNELEDKYIQEFKKLQEKAEACNNIALLVGMSLEADTLKTKMYTEMSNKDMLIRDKEDGDDNYDTKKIKHINISSVNLSSTWRINDTQDLDKYIDHIRKKIEDELDENTVVNIQF